MKTFFLLALLALVAGCDFKLGPRAVDDTTGPSSSSNTSKLVSYADIKKEWAKKNFTDRTAYISGLPVLEWTGKVKDFVSPKLEIDVGANSAQPLEMTVGGSELLAKAGELIQFKNITFKVRITTVSATLISGTLISIS